MDQTERLIAMIQEQEEQLRQLVGDAQEHAEVVKREIVRVSEGREIAHAEVYCVGAVVKGGDAGLEIASRCKKFHGALFASVS